MRHALGFVAPLALGATALFLACSSDPQRAAFVANDVVEDGGKVDSGANSGESSGGFGSGETTCDLLTCKVANCGDGPTTTLTGKVYDPAGVNPLYNVQVYVPTIEPGEDLPPLSDSTVDGISCQTCASVALNPMTVALTNEKGEFTLENVPVDDHVPIVIQVGKWRRKFDIAVKNSCAENTVPDRTLSFPKNHTEGDIPQIAVTTGGADSLECLLRGIGIEDSEFVMGHGGSGHVHVFKGYSGHMGTPAEDFWNDATQLLKYDLLLLSCEGSETLTNKGSSAAGARKSLYDYLNAGGRAFATHFHYVWFKNSPAPDFRQIATWGSSTTGSGEYDVNTSFPKGESLANWLVNIGASSTLGKLSLDNTTGSFKAVNAPGVTWISRPSLPKYFSFNTPLDAPEDQQCGRAVFSDLHITNAAGPSSISSCQIGSGGLNAQQKALEFLLFDLSSCVQSDSEPPAPPTH